MIARVSTKASLGVMRVMSAALPNGVQPTFSSNLQIHGTIPKVHHRWNGLHDVWREEADPQDPGEIGRTDACLYGKSTGWAPQNHKQFQRINVFPDQH